MGERRSIAEARSRLPELVRRAESGKAVEITRRGELVAVLVGRREYERLVARPRGFSEAWAAFARDVDLGELDVDPDEVFAGVRDRAPGREPGL